jgi:PAS domain S-box-containing protein
MAKVIRRWAPALAAALPGLYVAMTGALMLARRIAEPDAAARLPSASVCVALFVCGLGLLAAVAGQRARTMRFAAAAIVALAAAGGAVQVVTGARAGLAMSPPTVVGLLLSALLLVVFDRPATRVQALLVQIGIGALLALAMVSIIAYGANPEGLLPWYRWSLMRPATAGAFLAAGISFLALAARSRWYASIYEHNEDEKILVLTLGIFSLLAIGMGVAAYVAVQANVERAVRGTLTQTVSDRAAFLDGLFTNRVTRASIIARRPSMHELMRERGERADEALYREALSYLDSGFTALAIVDADGHERARAGELSTDDVFAVPIANMRAEASLRWNEHFLLRVTTPVLDGSQVVGTIVSEQELDLLSRLQEDVGSIGRTAEWVLCAPRGERMACFPRRFAAWPELLPREHEGVRLPMHYALQGRRGIISGPDYRGDRVIAAYAPVSGTHLGVVLKMQLEEFYEPLRRDLDTWWRWYFAVVVAGALLVASQVRPVAQRLVRSEAKARERSEVLARSERALRDLYAALGDGILVLTPEGVIEFANPAAARIFGYERAALVGRPVAELIPEELREANRVATRRFLAEGTSNVIEAGALVFPAVRRDGTRFDVEFSLARMRLGDDLRLVAVVRDVSERTALERMKGEFIAAVSHELRTPLTSVMGSLELLREDAALDGSQHELIDMAWRNSRRLALLVDDVIDTERIESGGLRFETSRFALRGLLEEAVGLNAGYGASHGVAIALEEPVPEGEIEGDRSRLMQVLANLISNAVKFSPQGGEVTVRAEHAGPRARIEVCDRGPGVPEAFKPRIFSKFAQADASDARSKGGTGLGLAICKAIVGRSGGTIGFRDRDGGGTVFWFELPAG